METNETNKFLPVAVIVAGLLVAGAVLWNGSRAPAGPGDDGSGAGAAQVDIKDIDIAGDPFIGSADAPLTIAFWSDFQCPFCKNFEVGTLPQIIENYVNTGKVKLVFMDLAFLGSDSTVAALYNRSVWNLHPDKYVEWRTAMYAAQDEEGNQGFGDEASINALNASIAGIDAANVAADVKANTSKYQAEIDADKAEAGKIRVNATPSFVVGTELLQGALPYANFQATIEEQLK